MKLRMLLLAVVAVVGVALAQSEVPDPYSIELVKAALKTRSQGLIVSIVEKNLPRTGDGVSVGLLKTLREDELVDPRKIELFLPIIRSAFDRPESISLKINREPKATIFLLHYILDKTRGQSLRRKIEDTIHFVNERTSQASP